MMDLVLDTRAATKTGAELDAIEHPRALVWDSGERSAIKTAIRRRNRRETRQALRALR
jgi:hypothetical protein